MARQEQASVARQFLAASPNGIMVLPGRQDSDFLNFEVTRCDRSLSAGQQAMLVGFATMRCPFPAREPTQGRRVNALLKHNSGWPVEGLSMKGGAGCKRDSLVGEWRLVPPAPHEPYGKTTAFHFALDPSLTLSTVVGAPKALFSLRAGAAENEFECQNDLARESLGFRGLMAGRLKLPGSSQPLKDLHGNETGVSFMEHRPGYRLLGDFIKFCLQDEPAGWAVLHLEARHLLHGAVPSPDECVRNHLGFSFRMGRAKQYSLVRALLGQQAGHYDNFRFEPVKDHTIVTDTDTALRLRNMLRELRGPQMMRDVASDLSRMISNLGYYAYTATYKRKIEDRQVEPFHAPLMGFFGGLVSPEAISRESRYLQGVYLQFLQNKEARLDWIAGKLREALRTGCFEVPESRMQDTWRFEHFELMPAILMSCYRLIRQSPALRSHGFFLVEHKEQPLLRHFHARVAEHQSQLTAAHEAYVARQANQAMALAALLGRF